MHAVLVLCFRRDRLSDAFSIRPARFLAAFTMDFPEKPFQ